MADSFGVNFEKHPMVAPVWDRLQGLEQQLDRVDLAVNAILKHLNRSLPDRIGPSDGEPDALLSTSQPKGAPNSQVSDGPCEYKALDFGKAEIRLLALHNPGDDSEDIRGSIVHVSLEENQTARLRQYNAISYRWGEPMMDGRVIVDGHVFRVTQNLESALRQMRKRAAKEATAARASSPKTFWWIDQIYEAGSLEASTKKILKSRGNQVSLMRRIYRGAQSVHIWLGDAIEGSELATDVVNKIGRPPTPGPGEREVEYPRFSEGDVQKHWQALRLLLERSWWERSWIRQEVSLGSRTQVSWGDQSVSFDVISQAVMAIEYADNLDHQIPGLCSDADNSQAGDSMQQFTEKAHEAGHVDVHGYQYGAKYGIHERKDMFWVNFLSTDRMASSNLRYSPDDNTTLLSEREDRLKMQYLGLNLKLAQSYLLPASSESSLHPLRPIRAALKKYDVGRRLGICAGQQTPVLLPGDAMPGDAMAVFRGATFPYVLRKLSGAEGTAEQYVLVGEAFLSETAVNKAVAYAPKTMDAIHIV
ncbi:uncharacterized protein Z519_04206 [Cladophialophora bantiana CBS 173.52]|uniref:Heterokaryon incompatibility domain-containing protein n=1 Tax=Cladophialophora bantiana (strain ATCC 10958 / CBS 173.52 / CDC B-1940 / NIH 8579) TaxID=1442370 RepID=A0A0D2F0A4_CLAB1|nr:uncharacterized protein Z519_04206 [Cladophialophora bantiana CBS 173.52]KIW95621.1 hypothetical protein Z519_04206 [Cladophialophora bantiana CBS 173.52]